MKHRLPSTIALCCFESTARHSSVTKAADELCLTQSAVSRQIKKLEEVLKCALFTRVKQRLQLTNTGKEYQHEIAPLLEQLQSATKKLQENVSGRLKIGIEQSMTVHWLIPKLHDFQQQFPAIETDIITDIQQLYEQRSSYDVGVLYGDGLWPEFHSQFLFAEEFVAVCTPELLARHGSLETIEDIVRYPLLHHTSSPSSSEYWLQKAGFSSEEIKDLPGMRFALFRLLIDAARYGLGIAIVPHYLIENELKTGELVQAYKEYLLSKDSYYVVTQKSKKEDPKAQAFAQWLLAW